MKVLYHLPNNTFFAYKSYTFYILDIDSNVLDFVDIKGIPLFKRFLAMSRLLSRLFRLTPRTVESIDSRRFVVCLSHRLLLVDFSSKQIRVLNESRDGFSDPLNITTDGSTLYWGEYGNNPKRVGVRIYSLDQSLQLSVAYTFPEKSVRHVHNIIFDKKLDGYWIFTGDNEAQAGIYWADKNWTSVQPIRIGEQKYRAVIGFPYHNGIIYATDSVNKENSVFALLPEDNFYPKKLTTLNGSCILGIELKDYFIFSTTVEPQEGRGFFNLFSYKLGAGIKNNEVHIVRVSKADLSTKVVAKYKKDFWPMKLFQYGMIEFPKGQNCSNKLIYIPLACKKVDGKLLNINF